MNNIILVGMPGCGKSTVGVILAKTLGLNFIDTDIIICTQEKDTLQNIIEKKGLDAFTDIERKVGAELNTVDSVVATGGSMILYPEAMEHLKKNALTIYIKVELDEIKKRLTNIVSRGITFDAGEDIEDIYKNRTPLYEKYADITLEAKDFSIEQTVTELSEIFKLPKTD